MFEVLFATKSEGVPKMPWAPKEGDLSRGRTFGARMTRGRAMRTASRASYHGPRRGSGRSRPNRSKTRPKMHPLHS